MAGLKSEAEITAGLLGLELYVIVTGPARSERTRAVLPAHIEHQIQLERDGVLFAAGPLFTDGDESPLKGMIIIRADSFEEAKRIANSDPFHARGIRSYEIHKWIVNEGAIDVKIRLSDQSVTFR